MPTSGELARRLLDEGGPVYGFYPHLNPRVPGKPDTLNTPEHRGAVAEALLGMAPGSGEALSARDAWDASGRAGEALLQGRLGDAAKGYGDMALGVLGAIPAAGYIARGTKRGAEWMDRNVPEWVNRLLDAAAPSDPKNTTFVFAGPTAKTADHQALARAQEMASGGASREDVWRDTGWFQGVDGKWRFEIDDSASRLSGETPSVDRFGYLTGTEGAPIHHFTGLQHPELNNAYDFEHRLTGYYGENVPAEGVYNPSSFGMEASGPDADVARSVVLHEHQHPIQGIEGFARGGNRDEFTPEEIASERFRAQTPPSWTSVDVLPGDDDDLIRHALYRRLAGEVEARNVQSRMNMTPDQRRATPPWLTQDVPDDQQIVRQR